MAAEAAESSSGSDGEFDFEEQLRLEKLEKERLIANATGDQIPTFTDADGAVFEFDAEKKAWFPKIDEDFMARYQMSYGVAYDYDNMPVPSSSNVRTQAVEDDDELPKPSKPKNKKDKKDKKAATAQAAASSNTWFEVSEDKNTSVYVSNLPSDYTDEEFIELMQKCGLILLDPFTKNPKAKLYRNEDGSLKGDGRCCYIKVESVGLALQILDGYPLRDNKTLHVERAKFELKGNEFNPAKRRKLTNKEKQRIKERQEKLFDWRPEKLEIQRGRNERVAILKWMFTPNELDTDPDMYNDLHDDVKEESAKAGAVKKIVICDRNPEGVVMVHFKAPEDADKCIASMNGRFYGGRKIEAFTWDGKTKYHIEETDEERAKRLEKWYNFLEQSNQSGEASNAGTVTSSTAADIDAASTATIPPSSEASLMSSETIDDDQSLDSAASVAGSEVSSVISSFSEPNGNGSSNTAEMNGNKKRRRYRNAAGDLSDNSDDDAAYDSTDEEDN